MVTTSTPRPHGRGRAASLLTVLVALGVLGAPAGAAAQFGAHVEQVEPFSSAGTGWVGSQVGLGALPTLTVIGHDYDYSLNGPLHLDVGGFVGFGEQLLALRAAPGIKYKLFLDGLGVVPYAKANLVADLLMGDGARGHSLALGVRLGGGVRYFFHPRMGFGAELGVVLGIAAGDETASAVGPEALVGFEYLVP